MARATMAEIIAEMRRLASAGTVDHTVAGVSYWTDDQLQDVADAHARDYRRVPLTALAQYIDGGYVYKEYPIPIERARTRLERDAVVRTSDGATPPTYNIRWARGVVEFDADTGPSTFYLDARGINIYAAVADIWEQKAGLVANKTDWSSDNHRVQASQEYAHCMAQAEKYRALAGTGIAIARRVRTDERY